MNEEKEEVVKINFFKKIWYSITKFEKYPAMATEGFPRAIQYLATLTLILVIFICIGAIISTKETVGDIVTYIRNDIPEFTYSEGILNVESQETITIEAKQFGVDKILINTNLSEEQEEETIKGIKDDEKAILIFDDGVILKSIVSSGEYTKYTYKSTVDTLLEGKNANITKQNIIDFLESKDMYKYYVIFGIALLLYLFIGYFVIMLLDVLELALLGFITSVVARIRMRFVAIYNMAGYAITLSVFLNIAYIVVNYFINFTITYFQVAYIAIAYIYLIAAIFIIKDEFNRTQMKVAKIVEEQQKIKEQIDDKENEQPEEEGQKEEKENKENNEKEDNKLGENPNGSEA